MTIELANEEEKLEDLRISTLDEEEEEEEDVASNEDVEDDDIDSEDDDEDRVLMTLGFVEKPKNKWSLLRQYFPSKAGGSPAWLDPVNLPSGKSSLCDFCGEPLQFLLQVYAPLTKESTFHRALFIFMCPSSACLIRDQHEQLKQAPHTPQRSVKVFRCQLPRVNPFYSSEAPADNGSTQPLTAGALLCNWCGTWKGDKFCGSCKRARYCSSNHQTAHWKSSKSSHKVYCQKFDGTSGEQSESATSNSLWPEFEITNEDECELSDAEMLNGDGLVPGDQVDNSIKQVEKYFKGNVEARSLATFQERISQAPEQVLRYSSSAQAKPLWPMSGCRPSEQNIPKCNSCGCVRQFEFQVLPQLLYFFHDDTEDSLDWSTIAVYTCESSCGEQQVGGYKEEFAWVQPASQQ